MTVNIYNCPQSVVDKQSWVDGYNRAVEDRAAKNAWLATQRAIQPAPQEPPPLTDAEITSIAYACNALPEVVTDATLAVFARAIDARSRAFVQPAQPASKQEKTE
jgi:hypothetical protein